MNTAMLAQAAMAKRKQMGKTDDSDYVVEASGARKAGDVPKPKEHHKNYVQVAGPAIETSFMDSLPTISRPKGLPKKKYGGGFPPMDDQGRPILSFLGPDIIKKAEERALRLAHTDNTLKVRSGYGQATTKKKTTVNPLAAAAALKKKEDTKAKKTAALPKSNKDKAWKEYTAPNGMKYYHNSITGETTYEVPEIFKNSKRKSKQGEKKGVWKSYTDPRTGKKYYSNGTTTQWEKPPGF